MNPGIGIKPVRVFDIGRALLIGSIIVTSPFVALAAFDAATNWYLPSTHFTSIISLLLFPALWLSAAVYGRLRFKRIEFFEDLVYLFPARGTPIRLAYADLDVRWVVDGKGREFAELSAKGIGEGTQRWRVSDIRIGKLHTTLFPWLKAKTGETGSHSTLAP
jgi:hypothetical protein